MDDLSDFVWLEPTEACTAALTIGHVLRWCIVLGVPDIWVKDAASHLQNPLMQQLEKALNVVRRFAQANSLWSNGVCERMMREVVRTLKAV